MDTRASFRFVFLLAAICMLAGPMQARATDYQTLNAGWLLETARNLILTNDPWRSAGCGVEIASTPPDITVYRDGRLDVTGVLERLPNGLRDIGAVSVEVYVSGELYMRFDPSPYLAVTVRTFTASRDIDRGEIIAESDVNEVDTDVRSLPVGDLFDSLDNILGMAARVSIQSGRVLDSSMLELPTFVQRGETVQVSVPIGGIAITLQGIALDSGVLGDEIRVRNPDSGKIINAIVTGPSCAEIRVNT
jgi:flagella basal body P-ring formation protein FlgA